MSRGGRGGGRGGRRNGPDLSWEDADLDQPSSLYEKPSNIPGPLFPSRLLRTPKPLTAEEKAAAKGYLAYRTRCRRGPLYTVLDASEKIDDNTGKANKRGGFDPFNGQDRYSLRPAIKTEPSSNGIHHKSRATTAESRSAEGVGARTVPDLSAETGRGAYGYTLRLFPTELWGILDPKQTHPDWTKVKEDSLAYASLGKKSTPAQRRDKKRKRGTAALKIDEKLKSATTLDAEDDTARSRDQYDEDDEDEVLDGRRKRRHAGPGARLRRNETSNKAKRGLDAEDDYPDIDQDEGGGARDNDDDDDDAAGDGDEDEPEDSEFEESEDGQGDDYNAEQYFDAGDEDEFGDGDGGGGGGGDEGAY